MDPEPSRQFTNPHNRAKFCIRIPDLAEKCEKSDAAKEFPIDYKCEIKSKLFHLRQHLFKFKMVLPGNLILVSGIQINEIFKSINSIPFEGLPVTEWASISSHILGCLRVCVNLEMQMKLEDKVVSNS